MSEVPFAFVIFDGNLKLVNKADVCMNSILTNIENTYVTCEFLSSYGCHDRNYRFCLNMYAYYRFSWKLNS